LNDAHVLIGQFDSPYVRRVGITLRHYDVAFEHRPWSVFSDAEKVRAIYPPLRVPVLILPDGTVLGESAVMLDHLDRLVPAERRLVPPDGTGRTAVLRATSLATALAEKAVSLFYERRMHAEAAADWQARLESQITGALGMIERERAAASDYWIGGRLTQADITLACVMRFLREAHPALASPANAPATAAACARMEEMPAFREISQPYIPPGAA
jgi:glutathione S-transferase